MIDEALIARFRADCAIDRDYGPPIGIAVSGGPDSLALLLLAHAALPGQVYAATVDHGLRAESAAEAAFVAQVCRDMDVPHATLPVRVEPGNTQAQARAAHADFERAVPAARAAVRGAGAVGSVIVRITQTIMPLSVATRTPTRSTRSTHTKAGTRRGEAPTGMGPGGSVGGMPPGSEPVCQASGGTERAGGAWDAGAPGGGVETEGTAGGSGSGCPPPIGGVRP